MIIFILLIIFSITLSITDEDIILLYCLKDTLYNLLLLLIQLIDVD